MKVDSELDCCAPWMWNWMLRVGLLQMIECKRCYRVWFSQMWWLVDLYMRRHNSTGEAVLTRLAIRTFN